MIKNDRQYQQACKLVADFRASLALLAQGRDPNTSEWLFDEQMKTVTGEINRLESQIEEFENLRTGKINLPDLTSTVHRVPTLLIQYRIVKHLTQRDLAQMLGLHEQQIQKYESTNYNSASFDTICRIADVLEKA